MEKFTFFLLVLMGLLGVFWGLGGFNQLTPLPSSGLFASALAMVETDWNSGWGNFLISFDNFNNFHQVTLEKEEAVKVFDVWGKDKSNLIYLATDKGIFFSQDGGLTWNRFVSSNNEINEHSVVFRILPASQNEEDYFVSVYDGQKGKIYRTYDYFFNLEKLVDFDKEAVYDFYRWGDYLYLALSNGQLIRFNLKTQEAKLVNSFASPILRIFRSPNGYFYLLFKSGNLGRGVNLEKEFQKIELPSGNFLFAQGGVKKMALDEWGTLYLLSKDGLYLSFDDGLSFKLLKSLPLKGTIDAFGVKEGKIYVVVKNKLYISQDGGNNWKIKEIAGDFPIRSLFFVNQRVILSR